MKAVKLYAGTNSFGVAVEVAQGANGTWFSRSYGWNGFGNTWSKWAACDAPNHPKRILNQCEYAGAPEYNDIEECNQHLYIDYGFKTLRLYNGKLTVRLPN